MKKLLLTTLLALVSSLPASAHQIWIEQGGTAAVLHFGEFGDNLRETTPGLLDKFVTPAARLVGRDGVQALALRKTAQGFVLARTAAPGESIVAEDAAWPMFDSTHEGKTVRGMWTPAARWVSGLAAQQPVLDFDIVPTGQPGQFRVYYKDRPLPNAKVSAVIPNGWKREETTDEQGLVRFALPWRGTYVLEARHLDRQPGERKGERYDTASFVTSLSFNKPDGAPALAAGPVTPAGKP
ncbi:DUF4198 domain-containing protein [Massilia sp. IC2-477]|uniref:DUF4198 domain-containing protein n=1 Tax=Massilia sp. IC2-477 TaxID=2887198 RepID=UPI001D10FD2C|nr:DUF4198 domain-containing protein [Massilia sp. IC2-477]MCC2957520.1 DUF4198 domain-containing protein [Massilia sp. IC2-477]